MKYTITTAALAALALSGCMTLTEAEKGLKNQERLEQMVNRARNLPRTTEQPPAGTSATYHGLAGLAIYNQPAADETALFMVGDMEMTATFAEDGNTISGSVSDLFGGITNEVYGDGIYPTPFGADATGATGALILAGTIDDMWIDGTVDGSITHRDTTYDIAGDIKGTFSGADGTPGTPHVRFYEDQNGTHVTATTETETYEATTLGAGIKQ
ncbi:MAG: hypothetical protein CR993_05870 [Rhodobacterales bacterium]|nr:MAG: hypothetical protein CR993_05870 [Rhodobacterales bacterium]